VADDGEVAMQAVAQGTTTRLEFNPPGGLAPVLLVGLALSGATQPARAIELRSEAAGIVGNLDTTVTLGASLRVQDRDGDLIGVANGGRANSINGDDGNLNFNEGDLTSLSAKITHELDLNWRNFGFFSRVFYFYDAAIMDIDPERTEFTSEAKDAAGRDIEFLDAYGTGDFVIASRPLRLRFGKQVINWGESTFIQNGINIINPVDVTKLRVAGAELRDALDPVLALDISLGLSESLSLEGFWQFEEKTTEIEPGGTFFSTNDFASPGGKRVFLGFGQPPITDNPPLPPGANPPVGTSIPRSSDNEAKDAGQFGLALRYFVEQLNDTEFGLYYIRHHSRLPLISARTGTLAGLAAGDYADSARYFVEYPEDIDLVGASFNTSLGASGLALQGEFSYRFDQPLQVDDTELLFAGLSPVNPVFGQNQLGSFGFEERISGFRRKDILQGQLTATQLLGPKLGADQWAVLGEVGGTYVRNMESKDELRYEGPGTFTSGNPVFTQLGLQPATTTDGFADDFSWGYRVLMRGEYLGALGPVNLFPQIAFAHDVDGTTPQPLGNFVEGRKAVTLSLGAGYLNSLQGEISYTNFFGGGDFNLTKDRDFVSISVSYFF
jgi:Protein of unknown function (DUF1302)